jgi:hypothetical protein
MRIPRWAGLLVLAALAFWLGRGSSDLSAQALLPDGVFVRDSGGTIWLIIGGQRAQVPIFPADDSAIAQVGDTGMWVVPGEGGSVTLGGMPDYIFMAPVTAPAPAIMEVPATATPTVVPEDPGPTVSIQVDDERIIAGQTVSITVIAQDNGPIEWIQWEGTIEEDDDNDNQATGDPDLDSEHRHDCDGQTQCAFVWQVTPKTAGRYVLRARGEDEAGNRSVWVKIDFRVQAGAATSTPVPTSTPVAAAPVAPQASPAP